MSAASARTASRPASQPTLQSTSRPPDRGGAPEKLGAILSRVVREIEPLAPSRRAGGRPTIASLWAQAAGEELGADTRAVALQRGVLVVEVRAAALLLELDGFRKDELLARVVAAEPGGRVRSLRFRPGVF